MHAGLSVANRSDFQYPTQNTRISNRCSRPLFIMSVGILNVWEELLPSGRVHVVVALPDQKTSG